MKKLMLTLLAGILIFTVADAQSRGPGPKDKHPKVEKDSNQGPEEMIEKIISKIEEKTPLTNDEKEGLRGIFMDFHKEMRGGPDKMEAAIQKRNERARALLSDEKYIAYLEVMTELRPMHMRGQKGMAKTPGEHIIKALDEKAGLTVEEREGMIQIFREFQEQVQADPDNKKAAAEARDEKIKALLPAEKYEAYLELVKERKEDHKGHSKDKKGDKDNSRKFIPYKE